MSIAGDVVVTGGAGAIGSRLVRRLLQESAVDRVVVVDDLSSGHRWLLPEDRRVVLLEESIECSEPEELEALKAPTIFHLAAHFANQNSVEHPNDDLLVNGMGTLRMLQYAERVRSPLFVFASAGCAAGHEDTPYQIHKSLGEAYCRYFFPTVPSAVFRFHNSYGPGEVPGTYRNVVPNFIWAALNGDPIWIYGDGADQRDFVFVDDVVHELVAAEASLTPQEIGTGKLTSIIRLARRVCGACGVSDSLIRTGAPRRRWDHAGRAAVVTRRPRVALEDGLAHTVDWFRTNADRIRQSIGGQP